MTDICAATLRRDLVDWPKVHPRRGTSQKIRIPKAPACWKLIARKVAKREKQCRGYSRTNPRIEAVLATLAKYFEEPTEALAVTGQLELAQALGDSDGQRPCKGLVGYWYAREGPAFALEVLLKLRRAEHGWSQLRRYLSVAPQESYDQALAHAATLYSECKSDGRLFLAFTFPERQDWVNDMLALWRASGFQGYEGWILLASLGEDLMSDLTTIDSYEDDWFFRAKPYLPTLVVDQGARVTPLFETFLTHLSSPTNRKACAKYLTWLESPEIASFFAAKLGDRSLKELSVGYLASSPEIAIPVLAKTSGTAAKTLHRDLLQRSQSEPDSEVELPQVLKSPPWSRAPKLSKFVNLEALIPPQTSQGAMLPREAVKNLTVLLSLSELEQPHAALAEVRAACTSESLGKFAWSLAQQWLAANGNARNAWAFYGAAHFPSPSIVSEVCAVVRRWQKERSSRVVLGLDLLKQIGSDLALMHLAHFAEKGTARKVRLMAGERLSAVAKERGLSNEELADRIVPSLGLDANGEMTFDLGSRTLSVYFDETLKPLLQDSTGSQVARFPRKRKDDDEAKHAQASERWKLLCKDVKSVAIGQVRRLESAMVNGRRWTVAQYRDYLMGHPLLIHLVKRLVWGVYRGETVTACFRVCEDKTLASCQDGAYELPAEGYVGVVHPVGSDLRAWSELFQDYEIVQPFQQIERAVFTYPGPQLAALRGRKVDPKTLLGLRSLGWELEYAEYNFTILHKSLGKQMACLEFSPGLETYEMTSSGEQTLSGIGIARGSIADLTPLHYSELVRDMSLLLG